jgi:hypothetical protein
MGILDQQVQEFLESISQDVKRQKKLKHKLDKALVDPHFFVEDTQDDEISSSQSNSLKFSSRSEDEYASSMMSSNREFLGSDMIACVAHGMTIRREIRSVQESA